ncbi:MAG: glycosyltransferase [bacterium]|jgi:glycosyltransferase involved in cell wall biosynthesis|nr:glycosyltransferase [bacterium]
MHILFLNHNLIGRGTFFRCLGFARELVKQGHTVDLWTVANEPSFRGRTEWIDGVRVWITPRWGTVGSHDGGYALVDILCRCMAALLGRWDIVHAFDHRPNVLLPWLVLRWRDRLLRRNRLFMSDWCDWWTGGGITTSRRRFTWIDRFEQRVEELSKTASDGVTVISSVLHQRALQIGVCPARLSTIPSGVAIDSFPQYTTHASREKLHLPPEGPYYGFVGFSLWDLGLLAEAFALVKTRIPSAKLLVVGGGVEEKAKAILADRFQEGTDLFLPGVVLFREVPLYLGACDIQLMPMEDNLANRGRVPNKLFDYYASGRPVVVSPVGDAAAYVQIHQTGLVAEPSASGFAQRMITLWENPLLREQAGAAARRLAETEFSFVHQTQTLLQFYHSVSGHLDGKQEENS